ncbi:MAG TPA: type II toxin-antitoxin system VapC family toxin [Dehalococcoidia bacterium]|nr:type II toxin-antitoxin system VapC family toxin [Dehalococcoidia bacterium]
MATTRIDRLVVDASVAAKWHLPDRDEEHADQALLLLTQFQAGDLELLAPAHIRFEVPSVLTVATIRTPFRLTPEQAQAAIDAFLALPLATYDDTALLSAAFRLTTRYGLTYYDAVYLALAQREQAPLVTADRRAHARIAQLPEVLWLADWQLQA